MLYIHISKRNTQTHTTMSIPKPEQFDYSYKTGADVKEKATAFARAYQQWWGSNLTYFISEEGGRFFVNFNLYD